MVKKKPQNLEWLSGFEDCCFRYKTARKVSIVCRYFEGFSNRVGCSNFTSSSSWCVSSVLGHVFSRSLFEVFKGF